MPSIRVIWERIHPIILGLAAFFAWLSIGYKFSEYCARNMLAFDKLFDSLFGFTSITTGFLAGFYGTIQSITDGFIQEIRRSSTFDNFIMHTKHGIVIGFIFAMYTIPFMIVQPVPIEALALNNIMVASWAGLAVATLAMFFRVARHLFTLFETKVNRPRAGG